jgi:hypothetical protein
MPYPLTARREFIVTNDSRILARTIQFSSKQAISCDRRKHMALNNLTGNLCSQCDALPRCNFNAIGKQRVREKSRHDSVLFYSLLALTENLPPEA